MAGLVTMSLLRALMARSKLLKSAFNDIDNWVHHVM